MPPTSQRRCNTGASAEVLSDFSALHSYALFAPYLGIWSCSSFCAIIQFYLQIARKPRARPGIEQRNMLNARANVEHPFRVIKRKFGLAKVRFKGLQTNTAHLLTLFALSNLWMARRHLMEQVRPNAA